MRYKRSLLSSAVILALSTQGFAQDSDNELELSTVDSESIKRDAVIEVITVDIIKTQQIGDAEDLVRYIPGVSVSKGDDRWGSSGFNIRGLDEDRVAINVDGIPQGETLKYEGGQAYGYFKGSRNGVDIEALKSIEIVKGADGILSGSGSLAGAVNMTTKDPSDFLTPGEDDTGGAFKTGYSAANDEAMASISLANRTGKLESMLIYTHRDGHEFENYNMDWLDVDGSAREIPDPRDVELDSVLGKLIYNFTPSQKIGFVGSYYERNGATDSRSFNGGWYSDRMGDDISQTQRVGLFYELIAETALFDALSAKVNHQEVNFEANTGQHVTFSFGPAFSADEDRVDTRAYDQELLQFTLNLDKSFKLGEKVHDFSYGVEFRENDYVNTQTRISNSLLNDDGWVESNIGALIPTSESEVFTLYGLDTFAISNKSQVRLGLRYDDYTYNATADENFTDTTGALGEISFSAFNWTVGLEQRLTNTLNLEVGVSTGFRAPTIEEMYQVSGDLDDWALVPNPDLEPESSTNFDIALVGDYSAGFYRVGAFYSQYEDFIEYQQTTGINTNTGLPDPEGFRVPSNLNDVDIYGFEFSGYMDLNESFGWAQGLSTSLRATYNEGEQDDGDPVYSIQPFNTVWTMTYDDPAGNWGVNLFTSYTSGKKNSDSFNTDDTGLVTYPLYLSEAVTVVDLIGYYIIGDFTLTGGVYNLTDQFYYTWDSVRFVDQGDLRPGIGVSDDGIRRYSEPGRNFEVQLNYQF